MIINLKDIDSHLDLSEEVIIPSSYFDNTEIRALSPVAVEGTIKNHDDFYELNVNCHGTMTLPCSITLEDVELPFSFKITEILSEEEDEEGNFIKIDQNTLDIIPLLWQNIVLEIPIKVTKEGIDKNLSGDGWSLIQEEDIKKNNGLEEILNLTIGKE